MSRSSTVVRTLVVVTTAVGLITGAAGLAVVREQERRTILETGAEADLAAAERAAGVVDGRIDALLDQLTLLATREEIAELADEVETEIEVALRVTEELGQLAVVDLEGRAVAAAATATLLDADELADRDDVDMLLSAAGARVHDDGEGRSLEVSVPIESPPGTPVGVLIGQADLRLVAEEVSRPLRSGLRASLIGPDGVTLADRDPGRVGARLLPPLRDLPDERRLATIERPEGPTLIAVARLRMLDGAIAIEQLESQLIERSTGLRGPAGVLLLVVLAIVAAVIVIGQRLLRPLAPLASAVSRLREGEPGVRVEEAGTGEVADLARGFNEMAAALEHRRRELEEAERSARTSEEQLRLVVEGVRDYAIVLLDVDGAVKTWNTGARQVTGFPADRVLDRPMRTLVDPDDPATDPIPEATRTGRGESEGWYRRPDGSRYRGQLTVTTLRRDDGSTYGFAAILQDVTKRQLIERTLEEALLREREAAAELRSANELKDEFLAVAAHEIRTPLSAILGASQLLAGGPSVLDEAEAAEVQQLVWRHASGMRDIVERLLDFTELQAGRVRLMPRPIELRTEFGRVVANTGRLLEAHEVVIEADDVRLEVDQALLRHVLSNLLSNAAKFSPAGTRIHVIGRLEGDDLVVTVADQGSGIAPEDHDRIFELFRQADHDTATARGTGVGLAIVQRYVELGGGSITVDSQRSEGARFTVRLPVTVTVDA